MRKELEPLWRFLKMNSNDGDPFNAMIHGIAELAEEGLVQSSNGRTILTRIESGDSSANQHLLADTPQMACMHTMLNTVGDKLLVSVSMVTHVASRTAAAFIVSNSGVSIEYFDPQAFLKNGWNDKTIYNATETAMQEDDGSIYYGFVRTETTPRISRDAGRFALQVKMLGTTANPIYICIDDIWSRSRRASVGKTAKNMFEMLGA